MTDLNARMPPGNDVTQRTVMKPAFSDDLLESVLSKANLQQAWKQVRANKGAGGVDGMAIEAFPTWVKAGHWSVVEQSIRSGDYQPAPVRRVEIDKPDGGKRQLGIPTVLDRVIQQAIAQSLMPIVDPGFSADSYDFRQGRNAHQTVRRDHRFARYADDFIILVNSRRAGDRVLASISHFLEHRLKLTVNTTKSRVVRTNDSKFLGFTFKGTQIHWHPETLRKFKQRIRTLTNRNWGVSRDWHRCVVDGSSFTVPGETPCAEPSVRRIGAGCCGGWGLDAPGYPIKTALPPMLLILGKKLLEQSL